MPEKRPPKRGAAKVRHLGRRKNQIARYYLHNHPRKKIRNLLKNNSVGEARAWAQKHGALPIFRKIANELGIEV